MTKISEIALLGKKEPSNYFGKLIKDQYKVIDSLKLRIPLESIKIINEFLDDEFWVFSKRTGEEIKDESFKKSAYFHENGGCKTYYKVEKQIGAKGTVNTYLTILLTSKILQQNYFKGIQKSTALEVYERLIEQNVIDLSFETFMIAECTDTDIKIDLLPSVKVKEIINELFRIAKPKKKAIEGCSVYTKKDNLGIQFALRKTSKYVNCPYLKFYEKVRELKYHSTNFYRKNLGEKDLPEEILRIETTIKNKKHFKHFKQENTSLSSVLENLQEIGTLAFTKAFECHLNMLPKHIAEDNKQKKLDKPVKLCIKDRLIYYAIKKNMEMGLPYKSSVESVLTANTFNKSERYKLRKQIEKIYKLKGSPVVDKKNIDMALFTHVADMISGGFAA